MQLGGKIEIKSKYKLAAKTLPILYTPGVAKISKIIARDKKLSFKYTIRKNAVAVISDGSAVLGLGNLGPEAALPVMEGKCLLMKELARVDAFPIVLNTQDTEEIIKTIKYLAPTFGAINLEDISAPRCFFIEERLKRELEIPVFHDDQHGTAIVVLAALINALKVTGKEIMKAKIVISGAGAAGIAITRILIKYGAKNIILADSKGIINKERVCGENPIKCQIADVINKDKICCSLYDAIQGADVFIGVSVPKILKARDIQKMNRKPIVFALSNPIPEIMPAEARKGGAYIVATGRSDFPNQINNILAFPGVFRGVLDFGVNLITDNHKIKAAEALAHLVKKPSCDKIIADALDKCAVTAVANVFKK